MAIIIIIVLIIEYLCISSLSSKNENIIKFYLILNI